MSTVKLQNPLGHVIKEVTVVRNCHDSAREVFQEAFQPRYRLCIQVVSWFVEKQHVWFRQQ